MITTQLAQEIKGKYLRGIWSTPNGRYKKSNPEGTNLITLPCKILKINCKGKLIYWQFDNDWSMLNTLGMTGSWTIGKKDSHPAMKFWISEDNHSKEGYDIFFNDVRHFGTIKFIQGKEELNKKLNSLGPDMLASPPEEMEFAAIIRIKGGNKTIAEVLMIQKIISGVGNYLRAESLYKARLSPWRICCTLTNEECSRLRLAIIETIKAAYKAGGTTISTFKDLNGHIGGFANQLQVYQKKIDPVGNPVKRETTMDNRTIYWVPGVQR